MGEVTVRRARSDEYDAVAEMTVDVYRALREGNLGPYEAELRDVASRDRDAEVYVAVDAEDDALLGAVAFAEFGSDYAEQAQPGEAVFRMLAVNPAHRRRGAGQALVEECIAISRRRGIRRLRLSTQPVMQDAHRLYDRLGFVRTPEWDWSPVPGIDLLTYALELERELGS